MRNEDIHYYTFGELNEMNIYNTHIVENIIYFSKAMVMNITIFHEKWRRSFLELISLYPVKKKTYKSIYVMNFILFICK